VVLQSKCLSYLARRRRLRIEYAEDAWLELAAAPQPVPQLAVEQVLLLGELLRRLKPRERRLLWLRLGLALSDCEVAARTGHRPGSVRKLVGRALLRARSAAAATGDGEGCTPEPAGEEDRS
jgi:DNA-directed RNA polymerase specialized sigma24 family protein